jgi:hypothetical protein
MKAWGLTELVAVSKLGQGDWPEEFTWRGRRRKVRRIEAYRKRGAHGRSADYAGPRRFRLKTEDGLSCEISHDVQRDRWLLERLYSNSGGA